MCLPVDAFKVEKEWTHAGLLCGVVLQKEAGHRCGYVRVPPGHPAHGKDYNEIEVQVHGGLTFGNIEPCLHQDGMGYWLGFDCAHAGDCTYDPDVKPEDVKNPVARELLTLHLELDAKYGRDAHYWTTQDTIEETEALAEQLARMS